MTRTSMLCLGLAGIMAAVAGMAQTPQSPAAAAPGDALRTRIESCVSRDHVDLHFGADAALLDDQDRVAVHVAILRRYRALLADGFTPSQIVLWRRPAGDWIYVSLLANPNRPSELCFTASFTGTSTEQTPALRRKYFGAALKDD